MNDLIAQRKQQEVKKGSRNMSVRVYRAEISNQVM